MQYAITIRTTEDGQRLAFTKDLEGVKGRYVYRVRPTTIEAINALLQEIKDNQ